MKKFIESFKGHWAKYLVQFPFEWWVTLSFKDLSNKQAGVSLPKLNSKPGPES